MMANESGVHRVPVPILALPDIEHHFIGYPLARSVRGVLLHGNYCLVGLPPNPVAVVHLDGSTRSNISAMFAAISL